MSKKKYNLNTIYISERLQENLKPISQSAFTAVTAPMGYGKTTAINWYLNKQSKNGISCVIRISIYSDNRSVFQQSVQKAFALAGLDFLDNYSYPSDAAGAGMLADEFTVEMALFITGNPEAGQILSLMTRQNAFITPLPDGVSFRFHHMMKECTQRAFAMRSHEKQTDFRNRYGQWYESRGQFLQALAAYNKALNYDAALAVIQKDAGILLASLSPEKVLAFLDACPTEILKNRPLNLRFSFCSDDVSPQIRNSGCRTGSYE